NGGVGIPHRSPVKRNERKEKLRVESLGSSTLKASLISAFDKLDAPSGGQPKNPSHEPARTVTPEPLVDHTTQSENNEGGCDTVCEQESDFQQKRGDMPPATPLATESERLFNNWSIAMDKLMYPFLDYLSDTTGKKLNRPPNVMVPTCSQKPSCPTKAHTILVLVHDCFEELVVEACECDPVSCVLVRHGLFPTSPVQPRMAISIALLDLYQALFERSCDAVMAFTDALHTFYKRRGFVHRNAKV
ncbi:hypothetical protein BKA70DRAFT_1040553, partial [Coprinopsis sp. MPI-PUGE-AT-0042]